MEAAENVDRAIVLRLGRGLTDLFLFRSLFQTGIAGLGKLILKFLNAPSRIDVL